MNKFKLAAMAAIGGDGDSAMRMNRSGAAFGKPDDETRQLERWEYGNPEEVAARRQAQSCHGCKHEEILRVATQHLKYCGKGRKHGRRCALYQPKGIWQ